MSTEDICWIYVEYNNFSKSNPIYRGYKFLFPKSSNTKKIVKLSQPQNLLYNIKKFYHPSVFCKMNYRHSLKCFKIKIWGLGIEKRDFFMWLFNAPYRQVEPLVLDYTVQLWHYFLLFRVHIPYKISLSFHQNKVSTENVYTRVGWLYCNAYAILWLYIYFSRFFGNKGPEI